jgi:hypothetical protein
MKSQVTGKTWGNMSNAEQAAHVIARAEDRSGFTSEQIQAGQQWLNENIGSAKKQTALFVKVRKAALARVEDGTFANPDENAADRAVLVGNAATGGTPSGPNNIGRGSEPSTGVGFRDPIDMSPYSLVSPNENNFALDGQTSGAWDNNKGWTLWNPETGEFQSFADPGSTSGVGGNDFRPGKGVTGYYFNHLGKFVLGILPSASTTIKLDNSTGEHDGYIALPPSNQTPVQPPTGQPPTGQPPTGGPPTGGPPTGQPPPYVPPPIPTFPVYPPVSYENVPPPPGDGVFVEGNPPADTSWDWDYFREKTPGDRMWGGYDTDYQAFERYQPGQDTPWGMPNIQGGNDEFYQQQTANYMREQQGFLNRQRNSQRAAYEAESNPYENWMAGENEWSWANNGKGLPTVTMGGGEPPPQTFKLRQGFTRDTSNLGILNSLSSLAAFSSKADQEKITNWSQTDANGNNPSDAFNWARQNNPNDFIQGFGSSLGADNKPFLTKIMNNLYIGSGTGPQAPSGYANPVGWGNNYTNVAASGE